MAIILFDNIENSLFQSETTAVDTEHEDCSSVIVIFSCT